MIYHYCILSIEEEKKTLSSRQEETDCDIIVKPLQILSSSDRY